jgi:hypothetical protein
VAADAIPPISTVPATRPANMVFSFIDIPPE